MSEEHCFLEGIHHLLSFHPSCPCVCRDPGALESCDIDILFRTDYSGVPHPRHVVQLWVSVNYLLQEEAFLVLLMVLTFAKLSLFFFNI